MCVTRGPKVTVLARNVRALHVALPTRICRLRFAQHMREICAGFARLEVALLDISLVVIFSGIIL
jgi:hypothetical protein